MMPRKKTFSFLFIVVLLVVIWIVSVSFAYAASLRIHVQNSQIDLDARQVPLIDLLKTISEKTEIIIESRDPLTELVSLNLKGASIEQCLRRLLGNRNYALTYKKTEDNQIIPASMHIFGTGFVTLVKSEAPPPPPENPFKKVKREWVEKAFGDANKISEQISAKPVADGPVGREILITKVSKNSFFSTIGLKSGDIVRDVNGKPVGTTSEFIEALQAANEEHNIIMIERLKNSTDIEPIYIELH